MKRTGRTGRLAGAVACAAAVLGLAAEPPKQKAAPAAPQARQWLRSMSLREKIAQLVVIPISGDFPNTRTREYRKLVHLIRNVRAGGLVLVNVANGRLVRRAEPYELAAFLNRAQRMARIPLIVAGDFERGASMRVESTTAFPHAMAFGAAGDPAATRYEGAVTAREARALGVHWILYPVADVNNNPDNPIINIRSFGEDPQAVAEHVRAFIEGAASERQSPVLTTAKHFPGHGDTSIDTHMSLATIAGDRARLERVELVPFRAAIAQGVDSVMSAHIAVPALDPTGAPATLSAPILTGLLRRDLGFRGLIVTDALDMGGVGEGAASGEVAVRALEAGADVLLMPPDPEAAVGAVLAAVRRGRISRRRIDESVLRILSAKERLSLHRRRTVSLDEIAEIVNSPEANQRAEEVASRAVTLIKNEGGVVPLKTPANACFLILAESRRSTQGQTMADEIQKRRPEAKALVLDPTMADADLEQAARAAAACPVTVVAAFASVAAYRGDTVLPGQFPALLDTLLSSGKPLVLIALGNPYLVRHFPKVSAYLATFSTVGASETAAVRCLFGEIPFRGRLPVTIPGIAERGAGIQTGDSAAR